MPLKPLRYFPGCLFAVLRHCPIKVTRLELAPGPPNLLHVPIPVLSPGVKDMKV